MIPIQIEGNKKAGHISYITYKSLFKIDQIPKFATAWMELKSIMLSDISQSEKDKCHMISLICGI